ncbi:MAG: Siroheme synthase [Candidatus Erwinia impunctatus]|nr:Siroheme synthase [Culicoides impunctatus]
MDYFPLFCQLKQRRCLLVGAGEIAERKASLLIQSGADLHVCALSFNAAFLRWAEQGKVTLHAEAFHPALLDGCWLVIAATQHRQVNQDIFQAAEARQCFCNVVDAPEHASAIMPSIVARSPLTVAIASGGLAPVMSRLLREKIEALLPHTLGPVVTFAGTLRRQIKTAIPCGIQRRRFWERLLSHTPLAQALATGDHARAAKLSEQLITAQNEPTGFVTLVGAGPGDPGLMTLNGLQQLQRADVVVYDRLVSDEILELIRRDAERIPVGKQAGRHSHSQTSINQLLIGLAKQGKHVVRLKGGDPFIFGRGAEEADALQHEGIPCTVIPGITAASGCAAYAGIPLTHRDHAQSVRLITGHVQEKKSLNWRQLATPGQTLVIYMGLSQAAEIQQQLTNHAMPASTPVAVIENGTRPTQRTIVGALGQLTALCSTVISPSLIIVGDVVSLAKQSATSD